MRVTNYFTQGAKATAVALASLAALTACGTDRDRHGDDCTTFTTVGFSAPAPRPAPAPRIAPPAPRPAPAPRPNLNKPQTPRIAPRTPSAPTPAHPVPMSHTHTICHDGDDD